MHRFVLRVPALAASFVLLGACMTSPGNGSSVCGAESDISLAGFAVEPSVKVRIEASASPNGPFKAFATLTASDKALLLNDGTKIYAWDGKGHPPAEAWSTAAHGKRSTYVRASQSIKGGGPYYSFTFDEGSPWQGCMTDVMKSGKSAKDAAIHCQSPKSPIARVDAPESSTCPVRKRPWQASCSESAGVPSRFLAIPDDPKATTCPARGAGAGWTLSPVFRSGGPVVCVAQWTLARAPGNTELDALEAFANPYRRIDKVDPATGAPSHDLSKSKVVPAIYADCAAERSTCTNGTCAQSAARPIEGGTASLLTDLASGCPKCVVTEQGMMFAVLPPEYRSIPLSISNPSGRGGVLQVDPQGEQVLVISPPSNAAGPMTLGSFFDSPGADQDGMPLTVTPASWYEGRKRAATPSP